MMLKRMLQLSLVLTFIVILLGAYTRLADAGLGCPDWPGCYGQLSVPSNHSELERANSLFPALIVEADKAWPEMIHRYFAGSLGLLVFAISIMALVRHQGGRLLPFLLPCVVIFQALLGMWTVTMKLMPLVVMGHLLGGFTLLMLLALLYWRVTQKAWIHPPSGRCSSMKVVAISALVMLLMQIALGGWTSSNYAALICTELPICQGQWQDYLDFDAAFQLIQPPQASYEFGTLDYGARMTIHVTHRIGAIAVTTALIALIWQLAKQPHNQYQQQAWQLTALLALQLGLGLSNVIFSLPIGIAVAHNLGAALLLMNVLYVNYLLLRSRQRRYALKTLFGKEAFYE